jgi:beta-fructofuranosidase
MHRRTITYYVVFILLAQLLIIEAPFAQHVWKFEKKDSNPLKETNGNLTLELSSNWQKPELVAGIKGTGLRTDGYSTWLSVKSSQLSDKPASIGGWFALESYPTDTAAFFVLSDNKNGTAISACVEKFGKPFIGIKWNNEIRYYAAALNLPKFKWIHVALNLMDGKVALFINGELQQSVAFETKNPFQFHQLLIGKDAKQKSIGMFPVTAINGIIDEFRLSDKPLDVQQIRDEVKNSSSLTPRLAIPADRFANDLNRPAYHLLPASNWTNETHGLIYYKGRYHIFNQKNASNLFLGQINWGHFSSADLVNWTEHKPALSPEPLYDEYGIWSGHVVTNDDGIPAIIYTAGGKQMGIAIAFAKDSTLVDWIKYEDNPVIKGQPQGFSRTDLRDPYVFKEGATWYMVVGFGIKENEVEKGAVLLYKSNDLKKWTFLHTLFEGDPANDSSGIFWEMPVFLKMDGKYILLVNKVPNKGIPAVALYWTGDFINEKFIPGNKIPERLEIVNRLLSPSVAVDKNGLTTAIAIIPDEIGSAAAYKNGWTHLYSIPRVWTFKDGKINQSPHPALKKLRSNQASIALQAVAPDKNLMLSKGTRQLEFEVTVSLAGCKKFGLLVGKDATASEFTRIYYDMEKQEFIIDQTMSSKREHIPLNVRTGKYKIDENAKLNLHVFIDGSVIEVFINNKDAFTTRLFPQSSSADIVELFTEGGTLQLDRGTVWKLKPSKNKVDF